MKRERNHAFLRHGLICTCLLVLVACGAEQAPAPAPDTSSVDHALRADTVMPPQEAASTAAPRVDPNSGLVIDEGWELVLGHCAACHSASLVTQNRGSRETWEDMIRWMQETQGLWPLDPKTESIILDYLARNYPPAASSRRQPLPAEFLPANPYKENSAP
jgi:cytochrome c5